MIEVTYSDLKIDIQGHAGSAEYGKDLICASASILFYTLIENLREVELEGDCKTIVKELSGDASVAVSACNEAVEKAKRCIHFAVNGYRILADEYPEYISVRHS